MKAGADAKIAVSDGLNLDITLNPDFSNVEVDDIFTNLTRFEFFNCSFFSRRIVAGARLSGKIKSQFNSDCKRCLKWTQTEKSH